MFSRWFSRRQQDPDQQGSDQQGSDQQGSDQQGSGPETPMRVIAGLGNPGREYAETRHNVGFDVVEELRRRWDPESGTARRGTASGKRPAGSKRKFHGQLTEVRLRGERALLLTPDTYMNRSGASLLAVRDFYKTSDQDILVICDDFQLPLGTLRIRPQGSSGGQKGLDDIIRRLGSQAIPRLRIGIGPPPEGWDVADYVLSRFARKEREVMRDTIDRAADAAETWITDGIDGCMNQFNGANRIK